MGTSILAVATHNDSFDSAKRHAANKAPTATPCPSCVNNEVREIRAIAAEF